MYVDVIDELVFAAGYEAEGPIAAAILTGGFGRDGQRGFVEITGFTGMAWANELSELYDVVKPHADAYIGEGPPDAMVGLFVGSPGSEGRVHPEMARAHYSLFNVPFQPIVVYDPDSRVIALSARGPRVPFFNAPFRAVGMAERSAPDEPLKVEPQTGTNALVMGSHEEE